MRFILPLRNGRCTAVLLMAFLALFTKFHLAGQPEEHRSLPLDGVVDYGRDDKLQGTVSALLGENYEDAGHHKTRQTQIITVLLPFVKVLNKETAADVLNESDRCGLLSRFYIRYFVRWLYRKIQRITGEIQDQLFDGTQTGQIPLTHTLVLHILGRFEDILYDRISTAETMLYPLVKRVLCCSLKDLLGFLSSCKLGERIFFLGGMTKLVNWRATAQLGGTLRNHLNLGSLKVFLLSFLGFLATNIEYALLSYLNFIYNRDIPQCLKSLLGHDMSVCLSFLMHLLRSIKQKTFRYLRKFLFVVKKRFSNKTIEEATKIHHPRSESSPSIAGVARRVWDHIKCDFHILHDCTKEINLLGKLCYQVLLFLYRESLFFLSASLIRFLMIDWCYSIETKIRQHPSLSTFVKQIMHYIVRYYFCLIAQALNAINCKLAAKFDGLTRFNFAELQLRITFRVGRKWIGFKSFAKTSLPKHFSSLLTKVSCCFIDDYIADLRYDIEMECPYGSPLYHFWQYFISSISQPLNDLMEDTIREICKIFGPPKPFDYSGNS